MAIITITATTLAALGAKFVCDNWSNIKSGIKDFLGIDDSAPQIDVPIGLESKSEKERIALENARSSAVHIFQEKVNDESTKFENQVKNEYKSFFSNLINVMESNNVDASNLEKFIDEKASSFAHKMRDEVNMKVCSYNPDWEGIISKTVNSEDDVSRIKEEANQYTHKVYVTAKKNLLDAFFHAIVETNEKIKDLLGEEEAKLRKAKQRFVQLTKDKDSKNEELLRIAKENALMLFIKHESERKI